MCQEHYNLSKLNLASVRPVLMICVYSVGEIGGLSMHGNCKEKCSKRQASKANAKKKRGKIANASKK